ncbi:MAG: hypothetical protein WCC66_09765 [Rhizobiaceae bacterium]
MKTNLTRVFALSIGLLSASQALAVTPRLTVADSVRTLPLVSVEADCFAIGQEKAAEMGGTLAKAAPDTDGDTPVCRLVIVVPGQDGERPKRVVLVVPQ